MAALVLGEKGMRLGALDIGFSGDLHVRHELIETDIAKPLKLFFLSDLHFWGTPGSNPRRAIVEAAQTNRPDLILLGGDLADSENGLRDLTMLIAELSQVAPILAAPGNHDLALGLRKVKASVERGGAQWVGGRSIKVEKDGLHLCQIEGRVRPQNKKGGVPRVLLVHDPKAFPAAVQEGYQAVIAGHLHGGQFVFWKHGNCLYPGRFFFRWMGLRFTEKDCTMLVSCGAGDLFPLRYACPREAVLCHLVPKKR